MRLRLVRGKNWGQGNLSTYCPQRGGWGGHWPTRSEIPQLTTGKGKETMEDPVDLQLIPDVYQPASKRHAGPRHTGDSCHNLGGGSGITGAAFISDRLPPQRAQEPSDHDMQTKNSPSNRNPFGKPRPPRPNKKPSVTKYLTINVQTLRDRGHGLVPSPNINFGYLSPTSDCTALAICPLPLMLLPFICSVLNKL